MYDLDASVLLLGVDSQNNTSLHLAEYRAEYPGKQEVTAGAPVLVDGVRQWAAYRDLNWDSEDFAAVGEDFGWETGLIAHGYVAASAAQLMPQRELIDYGVNWLERKRL
ncbi:SPBc2 prophage-derived aminoglycoside N(3')-acetyltransferase-like protein YokD [compost metagenome]